jgi:hypothetical protein
MPAVRCLLAFGRDGNWRFIAVAFGSTLSEARCTVARKLLRYAYRIFGVRQRPGA